MEMRIKTINNKIDTKNNTITLDMTVFLIQTLIFLKLHNSEIKKQIGIKKFARPINGIFINEYYFNGLL